MSAAIAIVMPAHAIVAVLIRLQVINGVVLAPELLFVLREHDHFHVLQLELLAQVFRGAPDHEPDDEQADQGD